MSNAENRDAIARALGMTKAHQWTAMLSDRHMSYCKNCGIIQGSGAGAKKDCERAPEIPNTADAALDAFARLLPGQSWARWGDGVYITMTTGQVKDAIEVPDTGDFKADLFALVVKALEARKA